MSARALTASQLASIAALPEHEEAIAPTAESRMAASVYTDPARFELEQSKLIRRTPIPLTLSATLPERNMAYAHDGFGLPIVVTRDRDGRAHAFLNACTHRGSKLFHGEGASHCSRLTCPFHAWTFDLGGRLVGVPRAETFPTLDRTQRGLRRLATHEAGGIIWVGLDPQADIDFSVVHSQLTADFDAFGLADMHVYRSKTYDLAANWKLLIETFLETYHVPPLHRNTVAKHFAEVPTVMTFLGPHSRQTTGRAHFKRDIVDLNVDDLHKTVTHAYHVFPTAVLVTSPHHINFITMMPRAANRTIVECHMVTKAPPDSERTRELYDRTFEFNMTAVFGQEDFKAAQYVQEGLQSGALQDVCFGGLEQALASLHRNIDLHLKEATP